MRFHLALSSVIFSNEVSAWRYKPREHSDLREGTRSLFYGNKTQLLNRRERLFQRLHDYDPRKIDVSRNQEENDHHPLQATCDPNAPIDVGILQCGEGYDCVPIHRGPKGGTNDGTGICIPTTSSINWGSKHQGTRWMADEYYEGDLCQEAVRRAENGETYPYYCDYTQFNFEDASGHFTCHDARCQVDYIGTSKEVFCYQTAYHYDCDQSPPYLFICDRILCTTNEQVCAQQDLYVFRDGQAFDWQAFEVDGKACTIRECPRESCSTGDTYCYETIEEWPDCPGITVSFCDNRFFFEKLVDEESCESPFSIPDVTGLSTCNENAANDITMLGKEWEGFCGTLNFGYQNGSNNNNNNNAGGTQGGSNPKPTNKANIPIIEGQSSGSIVVGTLLSILFAGIVTDLLLVGFQ